MILLRLIGLAVCWSLAVCCSLAVSPKSVDAKIIYVKQLSNASQTDGASWPSAYPTIREAVSASSPGDQLWIASGVYLETEVIIKPNLLVMGGFKGGETHPGQRENQTPQSVINGAEQPKSLMALSDGVALDRLVFQNAGDSAVVMNGVKARIQNCVFQNNQSAYGAGILCVNGADAQIESCAFQANLALGGSAAAILNSSPRFVDCVFDDNKTTDAKEQPGGGAVTISGDSSPYFVKCEFSKNIGYTVGGVMCGSNASPQFEHCAFRWNRSSLYGGAMTCFESMLQIEECSFSWNYSDLYGGALFAQESNVAIRSSEFFRNQVGRESGIGGALCQKQGILNVEQSNFANNAASRAGGLYIEGADGSRIAKSRFHRNVATDYAGGICVAETKPFFFEHSELEANLASKAAGGMYIAMNSAANIQHGTVSNNVVTRYLGAGAGIHLEDHSTAEISFTKFFHNQLSSWTTLGGGFHAFNQCEALLHFCLFYHNDASMGADVGSRNHCRILMQNCTVMGDPKKQSIGIDCHETSEEVDRVEYFMSTSSAMLVNSVVWGHKFAFPFQMANRAPNILGPGQSMELPAYQSIDQLGFANPAEMDYALRDDSPLIDQGISAQDFGSLVAIDGDGDGVARWDIGAFEYDPAMQSGN